MTKKLKKFISIAGGLGTVAGGITTLIFAFRETPFTEKTIVESKKEAERYLKAFIAFLKSGSEDKKDLFESIKEKAKAIKENPFKVIEYAQAINKELIKEKQLETDGEAITKIRDLNYFNREQLEKETQENKQLLEAFKKIAEFKETTEGEEKKNDFCQHAQKELVLRILKEGFKYSFDNDSLSSYIFPTCLKTSKPS